MSDGLFTLAVTVPEYKIDYASDDSGTSIWRVERPAKSEGHPTMKPVNLVAIALRNSSKAGDLVLDLFGGSGSTLIAAEQTKRNACLMEMDPKYVDLIIDRWENLTGQKAALIS